MTRELSHKKIIEMKNNIIEMKHSKITATIIYLAIKSVTARTLKETYQGPGRIKCYDGACDFSIDPSLGCNDPCHTYTINNAFEYSFLDVAKVSRKTRNYPSLDLCYYNKATEIYTGDW